MTTAAAESHDAWFVVFQSVRHVALVALNSAAHNKPALIRDLLDTILPKLYIETKIRVSAQIFTTLILQSLFCAERINPWGGDGAI